MSSSTPVSNSTASIAERPAQPVVASVSPWRRTWRNFKCQKLGYWSLIIFVVLFVVSMLADVLANDRPLVVHYNGQYNHEVGS